MTAGKQHIAVVDDEVESREMIGEYLALHDFRVSLCDGGASLRELMSRDMPDLIILDLNMPEEDGLSIVRWTEAVHRRARDHADSHARAPSTAWWGSSLERTTTWPSPASFASCWRASARSCGGCDGCARCRRNAGWPQSCPSTSSASAGWCRRTNRGTLASVDAVLGQVIAPSLAIRNGTLFKMLGDGALVEFVSVVEAVEWAVVVPAGHCGTGRQRPTPCRSASASRSATSSSTTTTASARASRWPSGYRRLRSPGGVTLSDYAHQLVRGKTSAQFIDGGLHTLKNIAEPMRIWHWAPEATAGTALRRRLLAH